MVCGKCQQLQKQTQLATPAVKKKNEMYYGSPAGNKTASTSGSKPSATLGQTGVSKAWTMILHRGPQNIRLTRDPVEQTAE